MPALPSDVRKKKMKTAVDIFAGGNRNADAIALAIGVSSRTLYRWIKTDEWNAALDALNYEGPRNFRTRVGRRKVDPVLYAKARTVFLAKTPGMSKREILKKMQAAVPNATPRQISSWFKRLEQEESQEA